VGSFNANSSADQRHVGCCICDTAGNHVLQLHSWGVLGTRTFRSRNIVSERCAPAFHVTHMCIARGASRREGSAQPSIRRRQPGDHHGVTWRLRCRPAFHRDSVELVHLRINSTSRQRTLMTRVAWIPDTPPDVFLKHIRVKLECMSHRSALAKTQLQLRGSLQRERGQAWHGRWGGMRFTCSIDVHIYKRCCLAIICTGTIAATGHQLEDGVAWRPAVFVTTAVLAVEICAKQRSSQECEQRVNGPNCCTCACFLRHAGPFGAVASIFADELHPFQKSSQSDQMQMSAFGEFGPPYLSQNPLARPPNRSR
jgi:hypothetical protein